MEGGFIKDRTIRVLGSLTKERGLGNCQLRQPSDFRVDHSISEAWGGHEVGHLRF